MRIASSVRVTRRSPRSPWNQARTSTTGRPISSARAVSCWSCSGQWKSVGDVGEALQQAPGTGGVGNAPLHHLAAAQSAPEVVVCRCLGHVGASRSLWARALEAVIPAGSIRRRKV